jgi:pimeloyl-ACP methyl ester carboxylesterase
MKSVISLVLLLMSVACNNQGSNTTVSDTSPSAARDTSLARPAIPPSDFKSQIVNINGINIHYVIGGTGEPLLLIHGFGQNWYMWNRLLPELSKHFTVIAPDLRGVGESDKPDSGYDKKTLAADLHGLIKKLGYTNINVVGHDIGLMVAYAYAAQYQDEVKKIALLDALLPGIEPVWSEVRAKAWWFGFFWLACVRRYCCWERKGISHQFLASCWPRAECVY